MIVNFERLTVLNAGTLKGEHRPGVSILDFDCGTAAAFEFGPTGRCIASRSACCGDDADRRVWRDTQEFDSAWTPVTLYAT